MDPTVGRYHLLRSCVCECIGTFFLLFPWDYVGGTSGPVAIGLMLAVNVCFRTLGANFNPAVSLAFFRGKLNLMAMIAYMITQLSQDLWVVLSPMA